MPLAASKHKWDVFRSYPRSKRSFLASDSHYIRRLQWIKFLIFIISHCSCLFAALVSKALVLVLATNVGMTTMSKKIKFYNDCSPPLSNQSFDRLSCLSASLWLIQLVPDLFSFIQDTSRLKLTKKADHSLIPMFIILECVRATGLMLLTITVLPFLDLPRSILFFCVFNCIPYFQHSLRNFRLSFDLKQSFCWRFGKIISSVPSTLLFIILFSGAYIWIILDSLSSSKLGVLLPFSFILCSVGYWECWIDVGHASGIFQEVYEIKYGMRALNPETRMCTCVCRFFCTSTVLYWSLRYHSVPFGTLITVFFKDFGLKDLEDPRHGFTIALFVILINFYLRVCFRFQAAMKINLISYGHPVFLTTPILLFVAYSLCHYVPICRLNVLLHHFGLSLFCIKTVNPIGQISDYYISLIWFVAYLFWSRSFATGGSTDPTDEIIESISPMTNGLDICQSLVVFHYAVAKKETDYENDDKLETDEKMQIVNGEMDQMLTLFVCVTMWHETKTEMTQMLRSILRLDKEKAIRLADKNLNSIKFQLEVHLLFDDAWTDDKECGRVPNNYFKLLFEVLMDLVKLENSEADTISKVLVNTPYGGRLVITLNGGTLLFVHMKDKKLIKNKKRWSQVMYMYYLLGHRIMDSHLSIEDRQLQADNTYILALDGDSKFTPDAVLRLIHLMNVKSDVGCACGRIHPIGQGLMVWYQKFEYAIAHWFQKAAEHVFGCVLCAPGCFSLFRASALMDDDVMHKYTTIASQPRHFVQYDQGEDRWLSTLLLKKGYRIEYAAAADAETYAPETFEEFFNQRRRWMPSSTANTIDLLTDYQIAIKNNESISRLYIFYQMIVIAFSLLGPAIIFTMIIYAQVSAFAVDSSRVLSYNAIPICAFIVSCFVFESSTQLSLAKLISIAYAFVMLAVLIATTNQIVLETAFSPTSMFVLSMVFMFLFASIIHPKEFVNIIYGSIFFLMIPSTYVLLSLYSLINLNVINWGTREAVAEATGQSSYKSNFFERMVRRVLNFTDESSPLARLIVGLRQPRENSSTDKIQSLEQKFDRAERLLLSIKESIETTNNNTSNDNSSPSDCPSTASQNARQPQMIHYIVRDGVQDERSVEFTSNNLVGFRAVAHRRLETRAHHNQITIPPSTFRRSLWMDCEYLQCCDRGKLRLGEETFWNELIDQYLKPVESTPEEQRNIAKGLVSLRNRIAFAIILLNALLVLAVFLIQRHKDVLSIKMIPYEGFKWTKLNETTGKFEETEEALKVDPLGIGIVFFLMGILIVQTIGMLIHRLNTLVEALHELSEMNESNYSTFKFNSYKTVLNEARQMIDTTSYERAHGADGYVRHGLGENKAQKNVLYKLQTST